MKNLLIVDNNEEIRELLKLVLSSVKYHTHFASDGHEACDFLNLNTVDLVMTDFRMPKMNGQELIGLINGQFPKVPRRLISTCNLSKNDGDSFHNYSLSKPFSISELLGLVGGILEEKV